MQMSPKFQQKVIPCLCHPSIFTIVATIATSTFVPFGWTCLGLLISLEMLLNFFNVQTSINVVLPLYECKCLEKNVVLLMCVHVYAKIINHHQIPFLKFFEHLDDRWWGFIAFHYKEFVYQWLVFLVINDIFSHKFHMQLLQCLITLDKSHKILYTKNMTSHQIKIISRCN